MLGVRLPDDLERRLNALALKTKRPKSFFVKEALADYLDEYESVYQAVEHYRLHKKNGTLKTYTLDEIKKRLGLTDDDVDTAHIDNL